MRWYTWLFTLFLLVLAFGLGYFVEWFTSPLAAPLCMGIQALPADYLKYWGLVAAGFGLAVLVIIIELGVIIGRLGRAQAQQARAR